MHSSIPGFNPRPITDPSGEASPVTVVLGSQWGDEGKGKLVDLLAQKASLCARFNGGANAGHTLVVEGHKFAFHLLPCGIVNRTCNNLIGNGVVLHIPTLLKEIEQLAEFDPNALKRVFISSRASLLFDCHQIVDGILEAAKDSKAIGTTKRGIGPCYSTKTIRNGLRVGDLLHLETFEAKLRQLVSWLRNRYGFAYNVEDEMERYREYANLLRPQIVDSVLVMQRALKAGTQILIEGANACLLDIDFGTYPYVTSSNTTVGGVCTGLGVPPKFVDSVVGVVKAYTTRVGGGPFPTELPSVEEGSAGKHLLDVGREYGTTTGRPRRCGWLDLPLLKYSNVLNGYSSLNITKLDVLTGLPELKVCIAYEVDCQALPEGYFPDQLTELERVQCVFKEMEAWDQDISKCKKVCELPEAAVEYLSFIERNLEVPICWIGVGPGREDMIKVKPGELGTTSGLFCC